jgi:hypothetical protein
MVKNGKTQEENENEQQLCDILMPSNPNLNTEVCLKNDYFFPSDYCCLSLSRKEYFLKVTFFYIYFVECFDLRLVDIYCFYANFTSIHFVRDLSGFLCGIRI